MREADLLAIDQLHQRIGDIAPRIDLLHPERSRDVGQPPGMDMEHRGDGHVDIALIDAAVTGSAESRAHRQGVQHELAMAEVDALGKPGGAGGVEGCGAGVLVELRKGEMRVGGGQQGLVLAFEGERVSCASPLSSSSTSFFPGSTRSQICSSDRQKFAIDEDDIVFGVIDRVEHLLGRQPDIDCVQHRAHHRHGEETFQIAGGVPVHYSDRIAGLTPRPASRGQPVDPLAEFAVGESPFRPRRRSPGPTRGSSRS